MAKVKVFSILDKVTGIYSQPMFCLHKGQMIRMFSDEVSNPESNLAKHPGDYTLFGIGEWDDTIGQLSPLAEPEFVANATEFRTK